MEQLDGGMNRMSKFGFSSALDGPRRYLAANHVFHWFGKCRSNGRSRTNSANLPPSSLMGDGTASPIASQNPASVVYELGHSY
jgi:hypothetical protein